MDGALPATITNAQGEVIFSGDLNQAASSLNLYAEARDLVISTGNGSTAHLQRKLGLSWNDGEALMKRLEADGVVGPAERAGKRHVRKGGDERIGVAGAAAVAAEVDVLTASAQGRLKSFVERIERLEEDKAAVSGDLKEVYAEAKGEGFDTRILRKVVRLRATDKVKRDEEAAILDLYLSAIGEL